MKATLKTNCSDSRCVWVVPTSVWKPPNALGCGGERDPTAKVSAKLGWQLTCLRVSSLLQVLLRMSSPAKLVRLSCNEKSFSRASPTSTPDSSFAFCRWVVALFTKLVVKPKMRHLRLCLFNYASKRDHFSVMWWRCKAAQRPLC